MRLGTQELSSRTYYDYVWSALLTMEEELVQDLNEKRTEQHQMCVEEVQAAIILLAWEIWMTGYKDLVTDTLF
jgi:hypothetical protein